MAHRDTHGRHPLDSGPTGGPRSGTVRYRIVPTMLGVVLLLSACGPAATSATVASTTADGSTSAGAPAGKTFAVGQPVAFTTPDGAGTVTVNGVTRSSAPDVFGQPPKHGAFLIVDLTLAVSRGSATANPFGFSAQDAQSFTYQAAAGVAQQDIDSSNLSAGQQVRGQIAFDVPPGPVTVSWRTPLGTTVATWAIGG